MQNILESSSNALPYHVTEKDQSACEELARKWQIFLHTSRARSRRSFELYNIIERTQHTARVAFSSLCSLQASAYIAFQFTSQQFYISCLSVLSSALYNQSARVCLFDESSIFSAFSRHKRDSTWLHQLKLLALIWAQPILAWLSGRMEKWKSLQTIRATGQHLATLLSPTPRDSLVMLPKIR